MEHSSERQLTMVAALAALFGIVLLIIGVASGGAPLIGVGVALLFVALLVYVAYLVVDAVLDGLDRVRMAITGETTAAPQAPPVQDPQEPWLGGRQSMIEPREKDRT